VQYAPLAIAEVYIYRGPDGERMISDRPMRGYQLINKRDSLKDVGHILANRPISAGGPHKFQSYIKTASSRFDIDPALIEAVIQVESGFNPDAISTKGATGLMQLMADTASQYQVRDRHNPRENIPRENINAGASAVEKYNRIPPYPETRRYVTKVMSFRSQYRRLRYGAE